MPLFKGDRRGVETRDFEFRFDRQIKFTCVQMRWDERLYDASHVTAVQDQRHSTQDLRKPLFERNRVGENHRRATAPADGKAQALEHPSVPAGQDVRRNQTELQRAATERHDVDVSPHGAEVLRTYTEEEMKRPGRPIGRVVMPIAGVEVGLCV